MDIREELINRVNGLIQFIDDNEKELNEIDLCGIDISFVCGKENSEEVSYLSKTFGKTEVVTALISNRMIEDKTYRKNIRVSVKALSLLSSAMSLMKEKEAESN